MAEASDRDTLAQIMRDHRSPLPNVGYPGDEYDCCADALLAAGVRPPARVIETREELDALPIGSLVGEIREPDQAYIRNADVETRYPGWTKALDANTRICFDPPVLLLWEPKEGGRG